MNPGVGFPFPEIRLRDEEFRKFTNLLESSANDRIRAQECFQQSCNIVLIKTFGEIEAKYIGYLSILTGKNIVPVGPLVEDSVHEHEKKGIMEWLNNQKRSSAVFVSFGSEYFLSKEEIEEIAFGLELSRAPFIWVVRFPAGAIDTTLEMVLPKGFLDRVGDEGMVVEGWAPQTEILEHPSIGGFVSHCGWSSVLESMKLGVPIIGMPTHLDQPLNVRLVEEVGVGVEVKRNMNGRLEREEVAKVVRQLVLEKSGEGVRRKAKELKEKIRNKGDEEIDEVVQELVQLCRKKNKAGLAGNSTPTFASG